MATKSLQTLSKEKWEEAKVVELAGADQMSHRLKLMFWHWWEWERDIWKPKINKNIFKMLEMTAIMMLQMWFKERLLQQMIQILMLKGKSTKNGELAMVAEMLVRWIQETLCQLEEIWGAVFDLLSDKLKLMCWHWWGSERDFWKPKTNKNICKM